MEVHNPDLTHKTPHSCLSSSCFFSPPPRPDRQGVNSFLFQIKVFVTWTDRNRNRASSCFSVTLTPGEMEEEMWNNISHKQIKLTKEKQSPVKRMGTKAQEGHYEQPQLWNFLRKNEGQLCRDRVPLSWKNDYVWGHENKVRGKGEWKCVWEWERGNCRDR